MAALDEGGQDLWFVGLWGGQSPGDGQPGRCAHQVRLHAQKKLEGARCRRRASQACAAVPDPAGELDVDLKTPSAGAAALKASRSRWSRTEEGGVASWLLP
ncbi:hypothetical protein OG787_51255 [Streptomyces sp. NBC_00075]|uniref:hypothetical protein n=1 Tax=Streptomyces sp. NBC_00075 TaxID=2975641 RepID=UPI003243E597